MSRAAPSNDFRMKAIAASDGSLEDRDIDLVEQFLEIDAVQGEFEQRIAELMRKHRGDKQYLRRCRAARNEKAARVEQRKRDLLLLWFPGLKRLELSRH